ncbi:MAG: GNAT family N-acetyltransferase [Chloroflexota bacterium]
MTIPELATQRLLLRGWRESDRDAFAAMNADPVVMEHFPSRLDRAGSDAFMDRITAHWTTRGFGLWAVERTTDGAFLGFVGLTDPGFEASFMPAIEIGWRFARDGWGKGYATEAARAALVFGFESLARTEIVSFTAPANTRSIAVMERLGMTRDAAHDFDHPRVPVGHPLRRHVLYRLARGSYVNS